MQNRRKKMKDEQTFETGNPERSIHNVEDLFDKNIQLEMDSTLQNFSSQGLLDVFLEMLTAFRDEKEMRLLDIQNSLKSRETQKLTRTLHSLRGSFLSLGIDSMAGLLMEMEQQALSPKPDWSLMEKSFNQLSSHYRGFEKICDRLLH
jgi:HPt (histidine-containing phosphotransfer) domain-containing protein